MNISGVVSFLLVIVYRPILSVSFINLSVKFFVILPIEFLWRGSRALSHSTLLFAVFHLKFIAVSEQSQESG